MKSNHVFDSLHGQHFFLSYSAYLLSVISSLSGSVQC